MGRHPWWQETHQDCASSLTTLVDAATGASQSQSLTVESVAKIHRNENLFKYFYETLISTSLDGRITSAIVFPDVLLERSL